MVKVAVGDEAMDKTIKTNGHKLTVMGGENVSPRPRVRSSKAARRNPASTISAKPKAKKELTAREATLLAWQTTYANRHKWVA